MMAQVRDKSPVMMLLIMEDMLQEQDQPLADQLT